MLIELGVRSNDLFKRVIENILGFSVHVIVSNSPSLLYTASYSSALHCQLGFLTICSITFVFEASSHHSDGDGSFPLEKYF